MSRSNFLKITRFGRIISEVILYNTYLLLLEVESLFLSFLEEAEAELEVVTTEVTIPFEAEDKKSAIRYVRKQVVAVCWLQSISQNLMHPAT